MSRTGDEGDDFNSSDDEGDELDTAEELVFLPLTPRTLVEYFNPADSERTADSLPQLEHLDVLRV